MDLTARLDGFQRRHTWWGFPVAVLYKFIDDQGGYLAVLITYYGFVSLFPGLLLLISVLGYTLHNDPRLQQALLGSALEQFPVIGPQLQRNVSSIHGSRVGVIVGVSLVGFRVLTARSVPLADLMPGALSAGAAVELPQTGGALFVSHELSGASQVYGLFGLVLGLLAWLYLQAVIVVLCAEINVVRARRLWPRNLLAPFVDDVALTHADTDSYRSYVDSERFKPSQQVHTTFDHEP